MTTLFAGSNQLSRPPGRDVGMHDRVSARDGGVGSVIGFYTRVPETIVVRLDSGVSREYLPADLHRL